MATRYEALVCDLLSALLDSWTLWNRVAGGEEAGRRWRLAFLRRVSAGEPYRPFLDLVAEAAREAELPPRLAEELERRWDELRPWPEAPDVLRRVGVPIAVVTNCSERLGVRAAVRVGVELAAVVSTERAGHYKPHPDTYRLALSELNVPPERALYLAGAPYDVSGAAAVGMPVIWHDRARLGSSEGVPALAVVDRLQPVLEHLGQPCGAVR
jgi:2-haloacid dehalogenase